MTAVVIGYGNLLRGDDGVAARVLDLIDRQPGVTRRFTSQLTPEIAAEIAHADFAVFVDAEVRSGGVRIFEIDAGAGTAGIRLAHAAAPAGIVALAQQLFQFAGRAFVCSVPASDVALRVGLSAQGEASARVAARAVTRFLNGAIPPRGAVESSTETGTSYA